LLSHNYSHKKENCIEHNKFLSSKHNVMKIMPIEPKRVYTYYVGVYDVGVYDVGVYDVGVYDVGVYDVGIYDVGVYDVGVYD
jgi:hypothetical protein